MGSELTESALSYTISKKCQQQEVRKEVIFKVLNIRFTDRKLTFVKKWDRKKHL
jgi:hypothetical protein